jgi:hypothetical protein
MRLGSWPHFGAKHQNLEGRSKIETQKSQKYLLLDTMVKIVSLFQSRERPGAININFPFN